MGQAEERTDAQNDVSAADCRAQLARILDSADFDVPDREHRFLRYVVEETLSGRGDRIKAYSIAVEVFGRDASFDPQSDPIVRIEAGHLRRALERYYLTAGVSDSILITIPKGGYVPAFSRRIQRLPASRPPAMLAAPPLVDLPSRQRRALPFMTIAAAIFVGAMIAGPFAWWWSSPWTNVRMPERPRLLVQPFDDLTGTEASAAIARGLSQEVVGQLSKFKDITVVESVDAMPGSAANPPRFGLAGSVNLSKDAFRLRVRFINRADGTVLWGNNYDGGMNVTELVKAQSDIARDVATSLAQTYGVIFQVDALVRADNPPDDWAAYSCTLSYYAYRANTDAKLLPEVRSCLQKAVERFPTYATAWGLLSQVYIDETRFLYPADPAMSAASVVNALVAARRAVELDPLNIRGLQAEMFALYFNKEIDAAMAVGKRAMAINPNDTELIGEYGYRLALSGNWKEGCPLIAEARDRNPGPLAYYESGLALCSYFQGDYPQAVMWIKKAYSPGNANANYHAIAAAIFAEAGLPVDAARESAWLEANAPAFVRNGWRIATSRFARPQDGARIVASLRKAGLKIGD